MAHLQANKRRALAAMAVIGFAAVLAACHHNDDDDGIGQPPVAETPPPPPATTDAFIAFVTQLIAAPNETGEPVSVDGIAATTPETTEPQPVPAS